MAKTLTAAQHLANSLKDKPKTKPKKSTFSKFFPEDNSFIKVETIFTDAEDWYAEIAMQTGLNRYVEFWVSDYKTDAKLKQLKAFIDGAQKAVDFIEKSMKEKKPIVLDEKRVTKNRK